MSDSGLSIVATPNAARRGQNDASSKTFRAALALQQQGKWREADQQFQAVLRSDAHHFGALFSLACLRLAHDAPVDGLVFIEQALRERPDSAEALHAQACLFQALGRVPEAIESYRRAITLRPDYAEAYNNLAGLYSEQRRHQAALPLYEAALRIRPDFPELHNNIGVTLLSLNRPQAALEHFATAIAAKPEFADAHGNRGSALISLGRVAEAGQAFEEAIRLAPRNGKFYLDLARCRPFAPDDPRLAAMQSLADQPAGLPAESRIELQFALGKAFADLGQVERSFRHFRQGNALKRVNIRYDEAETLAVMDRLKLRFTRALFDRRTNIGDRSSVPVFVVGMPRSGTTLVEQILASHPHVFGAGERPELHQTVLHFASRGEQAATLFDALASLPDELLCQIGAQYLQDITALAPGAQKIIDKMPGNFLYVGLIALCLPNARIIHVRRDPADTCLSCFATLFSGQQPYAYNLAELGRYYRGYAALMAHWRAVVPEGLLLEVNYEDVVNDIEGQARRMVAHCGLDWDERCLQFYATQRTVQTASKVQVRQQLYNSSVGRAKAYGPMLAPLMLALGQAG